MLRFLVRFFAAIGLLTVVAMVASAVLIARFEPTVPDSVVLKLDLDRPLVEGPNGDGLAALLRREASLRDIVFALDRARTDPRVKGLVARIGGEEFGMAQAQELRAAVERFRASGRPALAWAESFGDGGGGTKAYFLASGFDEVWMQPVGLVGLTGLSAQVPFARAALDRLDIRPQIQQREEYKSLAESLTRTDFSPAHREMLQSVIGDITTQIVDGIARGRKLTPEAVRTIIDRAPLTDTEAAAAKLVDQLAYHDEVMDEVRARAGGAEILSVTDYLDAAGPPHHKGPTIALIHITGTIANGESSVDASLGSLVAGADTVREAFEDAVEDPEVRAVLLRIDSGGGSATASETIRRAVERTRGAGKPVIVSMGDAAASGGYWIAAQADRIVADPATLTGSIGVVVGKLAVGGLFDSLGIHWGVVEEGRNAGMWSALRPFTDSQEARLTAITNSVYASFIERVAKARNMSPEAVQAVAKGRVWTGAQALGIGLVDELGDMEKALERAREAVKLPADTPITLTTFPRPKSPLEQIVDAFSSDGLVEGVRTLALLGELRPMLAHLTRLAATPGTLRLDMPATGLEGRR